MSTDSTVTLGSALRYAMEGRAHKETRERLCGMQEGSQQMPAAMMAGTPRSPYHQPDPAASPASTAALWRVLTSAQRNQPEHALLMDSMRKLSEPRRALAKVQSHARAYAPSLKAVHMLQSF